jgi:tyrosine-protein kinase Etk/Wzc
LARLLVCGVQEEEGSAFLAAGLGRTLAREGRKVLLLDTDLRAGGLHEQLGAGSSPGLAEYLAGQAQAQDLPRATDTPGLSLIPAGQADDAQAQAWDPQRLKDLAQDLAQGYDLVILLAPPVLAASNALLISPWVDALVLVVECARTSQGDLDDSLQMLAPASLNLVGSVLYQRESDVYYRM